MTETAFETPTVAGSRIASNTQSVRTTARPMTRVDASRPTGSVVRAIGLVNR
jgi:hypothetical protein